MPIKYQSSKHATKTPHIQTVVIVLHINKQLWTLEIARGNAYVVVLVWVVKFGQTPINKSQLPVFVIDHNVVWFHVTVHDAFTVAEIQRLE